MELTNGPPNPHAGRDLTREAILEAATDLMRQVGVDKLSMRGVAAELDVSATALYYHVGSKASLLDAVITRLITSLRDGSETLEWARALEELLVALQYLASDYPGIQRYMAEHLESSATLLWMERILRVLKAGGFDDDQAASALVIVAFYNSAVPLRPKGAGRAGPWEDTHPDLLAARREQLQAQYPTLAAMVTSLKKPDEVMFRTGLRSLIAGLEVALGRPGARGG